MLSGAAPPVLTHHDPIIRGLAHNQGIIHPTEFVGKGPWAPNDAAPTNDPTLIQCRHCRWYSRFRMDRLSAGSTAAADCSDWCGACGRVASVQALGRKQGQPYKSNMHEVDLGVREMPFTVQIPNVREMLRYKDRWNQNDWTYNEANQEEEFVQHRLGQYPNLSVLLTSIPILPRDKLPLDGNIDCTTDLPVSANETQAVILENSRDLELLKLLYQIDSEFGHNTPTPWEGCSKWLAGDLQCVWDSSSRKGVIQMHVRLRSMSSSSYCKSSPSAMAAFLATWFHVGPFDLSDLFNLRASVPARLVLYHSQQSRIPVPPFTMSTPAAESMRNIASEREEILVNRHNKKIDDNRNRFSLTSGTGSAVLGGVCTNETDFEGIMRRFYREIAFECAAAIDERGDDSSFWHSHATGVVSDHRIMNATTMSAKLKVQFSSADASYALGTCYSPDDQLILRRTAKDARALQQETSSLKGLMDLLENRGHAEAPFVEGLTVELLPFQKQALQWAIERETTPGGVQSFFWTQLPSAAKPDRVFYNPILGKFSYSKPSLVRGGIVSAFKTCFCQYFLALS